MERVLIAVRVGETCRRASAGIDRVSTAGDVDVGEVEIDCPLRSYHIAPLAQRVVEFNEVARGAWREVYRPRPAAQNKSGDLLAKDCGMRCFVTNHLSLLSTASVSAVASLSR